MKLPITYKKQGKYEKKIRWSRSGTTERVWTASPALSAEISVWLHVFAKSGINLKWHQKREIH